ncbi:MAG: threonine synthase [Pseudomonadota bacterium]|jgi:threonine synthase
MNVVSTRGGVPPTSLSDAILAGLAPDGGLYVPQALPRLDGAAFDRATGLPAIAEALLTPFFAGDRLAPSLPALCAHAYAFDAPLVALPDGRSFVLELFHGPTAAFKDFGARFLAAAMGALRTPGAPEVTVLVATSGDTGSAVGAAFHCQPGVRVAILYPDGRVSPRQAHQLGCFGDNVAAFKVSGSFDDCQRLVKQAFGDAELRARRPLASANSISLGRLLPQMGYYAAAALRHARAGRAPLNLVVPTGNLGNAFAAVLARAVGLPIGDIVLASNANRVLADFLASGVYEARESLATLANAMDVGNPSNAERLRWLFPTHAALSQEVSAQWVDDATIRARIAEGEARHGQVWCPHTACAVEVLERLRRAGDDRDWAVVATAHPAKFETVVEPLVGHAVAPPAALAAMLERPAHAQLLAADYTALRERLLTAS